jgi:anti-anti-sigma factor
MTADGKDSLDIAVLKHDDNTVLFRLKGRIVDQKVTSLHRKIEHYCRKKIPQIIIDVSMVDFLNSHGLGMIVYFHTLMQKSGRQLLILNSNSDPNAYLENLFATTNLDKVLSIIRQL